MNVLATPRAPAPAELAELGVARISYASLLHREVMQRFASSLTALANGHHLN